MTGGPTDRHEENKSMDTRVRLVMHCGEQVNLKWDERSGSVGGHQKPSHQSPSYISVSCWHKYDEAESSRGTRAPWLSL